MATRTIGTEIVLTGEKQFNDAMKSVNNNLKNLRTDMARVSAEFDGNADSIEALTAKQKVLEQSVDQHRAKVDALTRMYEQAKKTSGENSSAADKYRQQLNQATVALLKEEKSLRQTTDALEEQKAAAADAADATDDLGDASKKAEPKIKAAGEAVEDAGKKADKSKGGFSGVVRGIGSLSAAALKAGAAVVALGAGLGVAGLTALVNFANEAAEAAKTAKEAGETLTGSQTAWLEYADKLDKLDVSVTKAKSALAGVLLPTLNNVSTSGAAYLNSFVRSMEAAGNDTQRQSAVISEYIAYGVEMILQNLPLYASVGADLLRGIKDGFLEAFPELSEAGVDLVFDFLESIIAGAPEVGQAGEVLFNELLVGLESRGPDLVLSAIQIVADLALWLIEHAPDVIPAAGKILEAVIDGLTEALPKLADAAGDMIVELGKYLTDPENLAKIAAKAWEIGVKIANSIWDGLVEIWNDLSTNFPGLIDALGAAANQTMMGSSNIAWGSVPGHSSGLDYVPYDNYLARLHRGEMVLTSAEAAAYRRADGVKGASKIVNLIINAKTITEAEINMVVDIVNRKLGEDL